MRELVLLSYKEWGPSAIFQLDNMRSSTQRKKQHFPCGNEQNLSAFLLSTFNSIFSITLFLPKHHIIKENKSYPSKKTYYLAHWPFIDIKNMLFCVLYVCVWAQSTWFIRFSFLFLVIFLQILYKFEAVDSS